MKAGSIISLTLFVGAILGASGMHVVTQTITQDLNSAKTGEASPEPIETITTNVIVRIVTNQNEVVIETNNKAELDELRRTLEERDAKLAELEKNRQEAEQRRKERSMSWRDREEKLKEENPERYEEAKKQRKEFRDRMTTSVNNKTTFLSDIDTSTMTDEEKEVHQELLRRITETQELIASIPEGTMPDHKKIAKFRENFSGIRELYDAERNYILKQVGGHLGYDEQGAEDFSSYINEVFELTSPSFPHGMRGGRPRSQESR